MPTKPHAADMESDDRLISTAEVSEMISLSPITLAQWRRTKPADELPFVKVGARAVRYRLSDVRKFIASRGKPAPR